MDKLKKQITLLPFLFMLHNIEEVIAIYLIKENVFTSHIYNLYQFIIAVSLFTLLGFIIVFAKNIYKTNVLYQYVIMGFVGMLFLNSFFPHIFSAIYFNAYTPGLLTASFLILPFTGYMLWKIHKMNFFPVKKELITIFTGGIVGLLLVFVFLGIGYIVVCF